MTQVQKESDRYHHDYYNSHDLFESGTWLEKPNATLMKIAEALVGHNGVRILDLGAGVGRNAIPMTMILETSIECVDCVDIVPIAMEKLRENAIRHGVSHLINPVLESISEYTITPNSYDLIAAMSVLENALKLDDFPIGIRKIQQGTKVAGFNCLSIATDLIERESATGERLTPIINSAFTAMHCEEVLRGLYKDWEIAHLDFSPFKQVVQRGEKQIEWSANYCLFVAIRRV